MLAGRVVVHAEEDVDEGCRAGRLLAKKVGQVAHETDLPERHSQVLVRVELACESVRLVERGHEAEELGRRDGGVNALVLQELVGRLNEEELQDAFDDDLAEDAAAVDGRAGFWWRDRLGAVGSGG